MTGGGSPAGFIGFPYQPFKQQTGKKPAGKVVQPYDFLYVPTGMSVVPRTEVTAA